MMMKKKINVVVEKDVQNDLVLVLNPPMDVIHHVNANHHVKIYSIISIISSAKIVNVLPVLVLPIGLLKTLKLPMDYEKLIAKHYIKRSSIVAGNYFFPLMYYTLWNIIDIRKSSMMKNLKNGRKNGIELRPMKN
jgi:hypothetical protein